MLTMMTRPLGLLALASLLTTAGAREAAAQADDPFEPVRGYIRRVIQERELPSVSVAAAMRGRIVWEESFGWANVEKRIPATPRTMYSVASMTKPFTATAVMSLAEGGRIALDAPVGTYLDGAQLISLAGDAEQATVARVMSHTAGLPLHSQSFYIGEPHRPPPMQETIARYGMIIFPPGTQYEYSNLGYGILGYAIGQVSGVSYADFMRRNVFAPLGLARTSVGIPPTFEDSTATRYGLDRRALPFYASDHPGADAIFSSAHDLVRFGMFHLGRDADVGRPILTQRARSNMQRPRTPEGVNPASGWGWNTTLEYGFRKVFHAGSMPGVSAMLALYPEHDLVIVVLLNALARDLRVEIGREVAAALIPAYAAARERAQGNASAQPRRAGAPPAQELVGSWTGRLRTWRGETPLRLVIKPDGDTHVRVGEQLETVLSNSRYDGSVVRGVFAARIDNPDLARDPDYLLALVVRLVEGRLVGRVTAASRTPPDRYEVSSFVSLERDASR